jgi:hypothetical protein
MTEWQDINLNDKVRVRLTDRGRAHHAKRYEELFARHADRYPYSPPAVDAEGWSEFQFWELFQVFGAVVGMGMAVPFETTVRVAPPPQEPAK